MNSWLSGQQVVVFIHTFLFAFMFFQVFSVKSIHRSQKRMLWLNGRQILPTLHGWKVSNDISNRQYCSSKMHLGEHWCCFRSLSFLLHTHCRPSGCHYAFLFLFFFDTTEFQDTSFPVLLRKQSLVCAFL